MNGNMKTMTYPSGKVITYNYTNDRAVSVLNGAANLASNITYKPFGSMNAITYGNGLGGTIGYDNQYRISSITAGAVLSLSYTGYDNNGNITAITDSLDATKNKSFTYDNLDRLWTATSTGIWGNLAWTYDGVGNRQTENANAYTYYQNTNKLNTANGLAFGYDNNGNTTTEAARQYVYNQNQRLIQVNDGSMTANYTYNGNGQRVKKVVGSTTTIFHYSLNGQIIAESNSAGNVTAEYVYFNGQPLAKLEGANTYYYHNDHLGTPQNLTDGNGNIVWSADYAAFGQANVNESSSITNNLRFPGQYFDAETGLHYNWNRYYDPFAGRYTQVDPIGLAGGLNPYLYAENNSINLGDALGLQPNSCDPNSSFTSRWWNNVVQTNTFFFSGWTRLGRTALGALTSGAVARQTGGVTLGMWWAVFPRGYATLGGMSGTTLAFLANAAINTAYVVTFMQVGIAAGSIVNALPVYGTNQSVGSWWVDYWWNVNHPQ